ncbi:ATP-binding protein [Streptomyces buecherae]|uniref:ATP-binding protein n=1 Tax=Streptomyces buecherae TaxID=2763006 RepID=UPI0036AF4891
MAAPFPSQPPGPPPHSGRAPRQHGVSQPPAEVPTPPTTPPPTAAGPTPGGLPPVGGQPYLTGPPNVAPALAAPPVPVGLPGAPPAQHPFLEWLRTPRRLAEPGIWAFGYRPKPSEEPDRIPTLRLVGGAVVAALCAWLLWSMLYDGFLGSYWYWPMYLLTPDSWYEAGGGRMGPGWWSVYLYEGIVFCAILVLFGRVGHWPELLRRLFAPLLRAMEEHNADPSRPPATPEADPAEWPEMRQAGARGAADRLAHDARAGLMNDVDHARITQVWTSARAQPSRLAAFTDTVLRHGAAACVHPSGARDLPVRIARHDLAVRQVRLGTAADDPRNPYQHRGVGLAVDPGVLGTSLLAVGPPGAGKTARLVGPVVEALCLQALAGQAAVVVVGAAGAGLGPDEAFDVVVKIGRPDSAYDLDLYGGATDADEAGGMLAEALLGDLTLTLPGGESQRASTAIAQLLGPFRAAHGRFPSVPELRELLEGAPTAWLALRKVLEATGQQAQARELDARERQAARPGDIGTVLAERLALLDRPAFAHFFKTDGASRPFSLRALEHPVRVRIDLPERGYAEASRLLARLVLAQFAESAVSRSDRSLFACLVLDDASHTVTPEALRALQRLRSANAGAVLTLRTLDDVPQALRSALLGAVGCRMAYAGLTTWDGAHFAEVWGKEWVETRDITDRQIISDEPLTKVLHFIRRVATGKAATAQSVTVRTVERERWSASELAHAVPPGHAVLSLTSVRGHSAPPVLVNLNG